MTTYLDKSTWVRRDLFEFFKGYSNPYFNICTQLDITRLRGLLRASKISVTLAYHYFALRVVNEIEPFRYRLKDDQVLIHDIVHGGTTVLMPNESFTFAYFDYHENFATFVQGAGAAIREVQTGDGALKPTMRDNVVYFTTIPWVSFTSFAHARNRGRGDSVPRIAFGKFTDQTGKSLLPISVEVHHALMDGLHVGRYLSRLEDLFMNPEPYLEFET